MEAILIQISPFATLQNETATGTTLYSFTATDAQIECLSFTEFGENNSNNSNNCHDDADESQSARERRESGLKHT